MKAPLLNPNKPLDLNNIIVPFLNKPYQSHRRLEVVVRTNQS